MLKLNPPRLVEGCGEVCDCVRHHDTVFRVNRTIGRQPTLIVRVAPRGNNPIRPTSDSPTCLAGSLAEQLSDERSLAETDTGSEGCQ